MIATPAGQEASPAATEYAYVPAPTITSISTNGGPASLASENGGSVITIDGKGFNLAALDWVNFGNPSQLLSQFFFNLVSVTGTEIEIQAPDFPISLGINLSVDPQKVAVTIQSIAGLSNSSDATYAGVPAVSAETATAGPTAGTNAGPDTGGTPIEIDGTGFANQSILVLFPDIETPYSIGSQYNFTAASDTKLTTTTVSQNPAVVDTQVCTVTDCSDPTSENNDPSDEFILYPPGDPKIDSITPSSGPATGGTAVTITGENLGCVTKISFGSVIAADAGNAEALLDCGSTDTVTVTAPPGGVGTVPVSLDTVESDATGAAAASGSFTYTKRPAQTLTVRRSGNGSGRVTSTPAGINCPHKCSHKFAFGKSVTLRARASKGSGFASWAGACSGKKSRCKVKATAARTVRAKFTRRKT